VIRDQGLGARLADIRRRARTLPIPPFVKLGALIALGVAPFIFFVVLQSADNPNEPEQLPTQPVGDQRVPLAFPFGTPEPSPTPSEGAGDSTTTSSKPPSPTPAQCGDGRDNDGDGRIDLADRGCTSRSDRSEANVVATTRPTTRPVVTTTTPPPPPTTQPPPTTVPPTTAAPPPEPTQPRATTTAVFKGECEDGIDNDGNGEIDAADWKCKLDLDDPPAQQSE